MGRSKNGLVFPAVLVLPHRIELWTSPLPREGPPFLAFPL
jgi:hypothetical protein